MNGASHTRPAQPMAARTSLLKSTMCAVVPRATSTPSTAMMWGQRWPIVLRMSSRFMSGRKNTL